MNEAKDVEAQLRAARLIGMASGDRDGGWLKPVLGSAGRALVCPDPDVGEEGRDRRSSTAAPEWRMAGFRKRKRESESESRAGMGTATGPCACCLLVVAGRAAVTADARFTQINHTLLITEIMWMCEL